MMNEHDTVAALSTGKGKSAIAAIRVSGDNAFSIVGKCITQTRVFKESPAQKIHVYSVTNPHSKKIIDQITAIKYRKPHSYTGEDMVELFCHGGEIVVEKILALLVDMGARLAKRGEFTRRAFINGKMDLLQAEAIQGLIESRSEKALENSIHAYMGGYKKKLLHWKKEIKELTRDIEAEIEFPGEDDVKKNKTNCIKNIIKIRKELELNININKKLQIIENGINIPIVGIPNAGKSSLFNLLLENERSIVHREEGTTRDSIGEDIIIAEEKVKLIDTAGLRKTENSVEMMGMQKTMEYIQNAPFVIWVTPVDCRFMEEEKVLLEKTAFGKTICVISKIDLGNGGDKKTLCEEEDIPYIEACLTTIKSRENLVDFIAKQIDKRIGSIEMSGVIRNKRQEEIARRMVERCNAIEENKESGEEIIALYLRKLLNDIGELAGETTTEEILESIFSEFCIGK